MDAKLNIRILNLAHAAEARAALEVVGSDAAGIKLMLPKALFRAVMLENIDSRGANIIKQEMLAQGGEAAVSRGVINYAQATSHVLLLGTIKQYRRLIGKLKMQPFGLAGVAAQLRQVLEGPAAGKPGVLNCRGKTLPLGERTLVMGILNLTPDSFADGGRYNRLDLALQRAEEMAAQGADIIDIGAESTRPGHVAITAAEEMERLLPVLRALVSRMKLPISVDTYKAAVARAALDAGADMLNDIWGFLADGQMPVVAAAARDVPVVIMHNQAGTQYQDLMADILRSLRRSIEIGRAAGLERARIIVDPGIGFGKDLAQNLATMRNLYQLQVLGLPVLLGTSRKSMIGKTLDLPVEERLEGTAATLTCGIAQGVDIVRVHDVKEMVRVVRMSDAMIRDAGGKGHGPD